MVCHNSLQDKENKEIYKQLKKNHVPQYQEKEITAQADVTDTTKQMTDTRFTWPAGNLKQDSLNWVKNMGGL